MANEVNLTVALEYSDSEDTDADLRIVNAQFTVGSKLPLRYKQNVGFAAAEAVRLVEFTALGHVLLVNRDATNYINVYTSNSGVLCAVLKPNGGSFLAYLGSGMQAPYVQANTGACQMDVLIISQ